MRRRFEPLMTSLAAACLVAASTGACIPDFSEGGQDAPTVPVWAGGTSQVEDPSQQLPPTASDKSFSLLTVEPSEGLVTGGTEVVLTGTGFKTGMVVLFGESEAIDLFIVTETMAVMRTPPHPAGLVDVSAYHPEIEQGLPRDLESAFRYYADLVVADVEPPEGHVNGGDALTVTGTGFSPDSRFFVGGRLAIAQTRVDDGTLTGIAPAGTFGPADVHVVNVSGTAVAKNAYTYRAPVELGGVAPVTGPAEGGTAVRLRGTGLTSDTVVLFGEAEATVAGADHAGEWLDVVAPAGPPGDIVDVTAASGWGVAVAENAWVWADPAEDPYILSCQTMFPAAGPAAGGTEVQLACGGLQYGVTVTFGGAEAEVVAADGATGQLSVKTPAGAPGAVDVKVDNGFDTVTVPGGFTYVAPPELAVTAVAPASGPVAGGTVITVDGAGFAPGSVVLVGALPAKDVVVEDATRLTAVTPQGSPGKADVRVLAQGEEASLPGGFEYTTTGLHLDLVTPTTAAQSGGTYMIVAGGGFGETAQVFFGEVEAALIERVSSAELHVRSPALEVGVYDATVIDGDASVTLPGALTVYDPRSGYGGTWGDPIDDTVNVTVRGSYGLGAVPGAFVILGTDPLTSLKGYTDENGQITFSEPGLTGPLTVTATHPEFDAYSVVEFDATNVTVFLRPKNPPTGTPGPSPTWKPATLRGKVIGLGKYVIPPPGACAGVAIDETEHCAPCEVSEGCDGADFACIELLDQGTHCAQSCSVPADCPEGYVCAPSTAGTRCVPSPGEKIAKCYVSTQSPFSYEPAIPAGGWVSPGEEFELPSGRLGDLAIICFGGYQTPDMVFTPTVMGIRRHVFAEDGAVQTGLDVELNHPLDRTFRLRMLDPPTWPSGVAPPSVTISIDLGSDGAIPMSRTLLDGPTEHTYLAPHQLAALTGDLYDAKYFFYTTIAASSTSTQPRSYNLVQGITTVAEDRLPVYDGSAWKLEAAQLEADLNGLWGASSDHLVAVGEDGLILLHTTGGWHAQSAPVEETLRAVTGRATGDIWAVGDKGTVIHWDGTSWQPVDAPKDDLRAVATAPGQPLYAAGKIRLRQYDGTSWSIAGPPSLQDVYGVAALEDGRVAAVGSLGRVFLRGADGSWTTLTADTNATLRAVWLGDDELLAVGDAGTVVRRFGDGPLELVDVGVDVDLTAISVGPDGTVYVVGDEGTALRRKLDGTWTSDEIPDYRSRAHAVLAPADGSSVRVVGSAAFILGPFLHYPIATAPLHEAGLTSPTLAWTWDGGVTGQYTQVTLSEETGAVLWTLMVDGAQKQVQLPDVFTAAGYTPLGSGKKRFEILRVLNDNFDIDGYTTREFSIYRRDSWATNLTFFYVP